MKVANMFILNLSHLMIDYKYQSKRQQGPVKTDRKHTGKWHFKI